MLIEEVASAGIDRARLAALAQFLTGRANDTASRKVISVPAFLKLAQNMQISLTGDQLRELVQQPPLSNIIANIEGDDDSGQVIFRGEDGDTVPGAEMSVDQARDTVDSMAKRAAKKGI
jgi:hypothetical protein